MIVGAGTKIAIVATAIIAVVAGLIWLGWSARSAVAERDMAEFKLDLEAHAEAQRQLKAMTEQSHDLVTEQSSKRLDELQAAQQKETVYVDRKVVEYRDRWRDRPCARPDWVRLYNESLFGPVHSVLEAR